MKLLFVCLGLLFVYQSAAACSCYTNPTPLVALQESAIVFEGTLLGFSDADTTDSVLSAHLEVSRSWKGVESTQIRVEDYGRYFPSIDHFSFTSCSVYWMIGKTYVVYAYDLPEGMPYFTHNCTRTRPVEYAQEDLAALGEGTPVAAEDAEPALSFTFGQNHPNPFRNRTQIPYTLTQPGHTTIKIYDVTGRLAKTVIDQQQSAGMYAAEVNLNGLPAGIYIYELRVGAETQRRTMVLLR